jgi:hypothetical protein
MVAKDSNPDWSDMVLLESLSRVECEVRFNLKRPAKRGKRVAAEIVCRWLARVTSSILLFSLDNQVAAY